MPALIKTARQNQVFCTTVDRNGGWQSQLQLSSIIRTKPNGLAGIQLDSNAATGDFTLSLSPANITAARRWSFPDRSDTVAGLGAQTFTGAQRISSSLDVHSNVLTGQSAGQVACQYIAIPDSGFSVGGANYSRFISYYTGTDFFFGTDAAGTGVARGFQFSSGTGQTTFSNTTDATSTTAAAVVVSGGVGIAKSLIIGGALTVNSATLIKSNTTLTNGAAAAAGTLLNAPAAGNPTKWIPINDNGTTRYVPAW
jgi:hypothetical protein